VLFGKLCRLIRLNGLVRAWSAHPLPTDESAGNRIMRRFDKANRARPSMLRFAACMFVAVLAIAGTACQLGAQATSSEVAPPKNTGAPYVQSYRVLAEHEPIVAQLLKKFAGVGQFRQIRDRPTSQWVVIAPAEIHLQIAQRLSPVEGVAKPQAALEGSSKTDRGKFRLKSLNAQTLHARLEKVLGRRLPIQQDATGQWHGFNVDQQGRRAVTIWANKQTGEAQISGLPNQVRSWHQVVAALDSPPDNKSATRVVATGPKSSVQVKQAVGVLQKSVLVAQKTRTKTEGQNSDEENNEADNEEHGLLGPVQIETVEGTDILVLRGNPDDVQRVMDVIEEIEKLAELGDPRIEIVKLEHITSTPLSTTLQRAFDESLSLKYGYDPLVVVPLLKPNAIMLIGLAKSVDKAMEIVSQLDQPGKKLTQFEIFRLEFAKATEARQVIQDLFNSVAPEGQPTLEEKAVVIADLRTNTLIVRAGAQDMESLRALIKVIDQQASDSVNELRIFKLQNALATELQAVLQDAFESSVTPTEGGSLSHLLRIMTIDAEGRRKLESGVLAGASVIASASTNALIVSAPPESMPLLAALIAQLDQMPDAIAELKVFTITNGDAVALSRMLEGLFGNPAQQQRSGPGGPGQSGLSGLRLEVDERTNSIIAAGTKEDLLVVEAVLLRLDADDAQKRENRVYRLNNAFAEEVAISLQDWVEGLREVLETAPGASSPFQQIEQEVVVVADVGSNSLIVSASPKYFEEIDRIIHQLDEQAPMVMIQVLIAEIVLGDTDEFGVELGLQDSALFDRSLLGDLQTTTNTTITNDPGGGSTQFVQEVIQSATNTPGFNFGNGTPLGNSGSDSSLTTASRVAAQGLASFGVSRISPNAGFSGLILSASSDSVSMLLRALQETRRVEVLSRPQIMAMDNQEGKAFVGQTVPFITGSFISQFGNTSNTITREEVGLSLRVTPRISPDGLVVMQIFAANDRLGDVADGVPIAFGPNGEPILSPLVNTIQAETTVSAVSGQTIVLSGLLTKRDTALHRRVPLLADIPLLGNLFRYDAVSTRRTELLIILTPHIVRNRFEAEMIKEVESARIDWCLSDVIGMHGPVGLRSRRDPAGAAEAEVIYPEQIAPQECQPTPEQYGPGEIEAPAEDFPQLPNVPTPAASEETRTPEQTASKSTIFRLPRLFGKSKETSTVK